MKNSQHILSKIPLWGLRGLFFLFLTFASCEKSDDPDPEPVPTPTPPTTPKENIVFNLDGNLIRAGKEKTGDAVFNIDGDYIRAGEKVTGDIVFNIDNSLIRAGKEKTGDVVYNFDETLPTFSNGQPLVSDYGLKPLYDLGQELIDIKDPKDIVIMINRILDVTHQRSDLAELFIEGGRESLDYISNS